MNDKHPGIEIIIYPVEAATKPAQAQLRPVPLHRTAAPAPQVKSDLGLQAIRVVLVAMLVVCVGYFAHRFSQPDEKPLAAKPPEKKELPAEPAPSAPPVEPSKAPEPPPVEPPKLPEPPPEPTNAPEPPPMPPPPAPEPSKAPEPDPKEVEFARLVEESNALLEIDPVGSLNRASLAVEIHADRADLWKRIGDLSLATGQKDRAVAAWTKTLELDPKQPSVLTNLGVLDLQAGRHDAALKRFEESLKYAATATACYNLANLHLAKNELSKAGHFYRRAMELDPKLKSAKYNLALVLERQGKLAESAGLLASIPTAEASRHRARIEATMGGASAAKAMDEARKSKDPELALAVADGFRKANELEKSLAMLSHAADLAPQDAKILMNRGGLRHLMGRLDEAVADYGAALKVDPSLAQAHYNLGLIAEERKKYIEALEHYTRALKVDSRLAPAHNNVGVLYLKVNQPAKAVDCFRRAVEADPSFAAGRLNLAWSLMGQGENKKALAEFKAYASLVPLDQLDPEAVKAMARLQEK